MMIVKRTQMIKVSATLKINNQNLKTESNDFLNQMRDYSAKVGSNLANNASTCASSQLKIFANSL